VHLNVTLCLGCWLLGGFVVLVIHEMYVFYIKSEEEMWLAAFNKMCSAAYCVQEQNLLLAVC